MTELSRLERRLFHSQLICLGLFCLNLGLFGYLCFAGRIVKVRGLVLVDGDGAERGGLRMGDRGPELTLRDAAGNGRVYLGAPNEDAVFQLCDGTGQPRITAATEPTGCGLGLLDERHQLRTEWRIAKHSPGLFMRDANATIRLGLGVSSDGPGLYLSDVSGRSRAELCALGNDVVRFLLRDEADRNRILIAYGKKEGAVVKRLNPSGQTHSRGVKTP